METPDELESVRYQELQAELREAAEAFSKWTEESKEARRFLAGHHWTDEEMASLESEHRPALTFNQYGQLINVVSGTEISNRYEPHYLPRTPEDQGGVDVVNEMVRYYRNDCDAAHEESLAFRDCLNEGIGVTEIYFDDDDDPNGKVKTVRVNPDELVWDPESERQNALDAQWVIRSRWVNAKEFRNLWPEQAEEFFTFLANSSGETVRETEMDVVDVRRSWMYASNSSSYDPQKDRVLVIEKQYWEYEPGYVLRDFQSGMLQYIEEEEVEQLYPQIIQSGISPEQILFQKQRKRYKREFWSGQTLLEEGDNPINRFTYNIMTGYKDSSADGEILWYGLFRPVKDPQYWANKFLSQIVHIIGSNPKGGLIYEEGAIPDVQRFAQEFAKPNFIGKVAPRAITNEQITILDPAELPQAAFQMADFALNAIPRLLGINPYLGGQANDLKRTPAQSIQAIIRQGLVSLAPMFDALKLYRKQVGRCYLDFIKMHVNPGTSVRIVGPQNAQFVQFTKDTAFMNYDVVVEEVPITPTDMMETWTTLTEQGLLSSLLEMGFPVPPSIIDIIPGLERYVKDEWKAMIQQMYAQPAPQEQPAQ